MSGEEGAEVVTAHKRIPGALTLHESRVESARVGGGRRRG